MFEASIPPVASFLLTKIMKISRLVFLFAVDTETLKFPVTKSDDPVDEENEGENFNSGVLLLIFRSFRNN